jgi:hypothetical protein
MNEELFRSICTAKLIEWYEQNAVAIRQEDTYTVWACKTLQNNKCMMSTTVHDGLYFEFTFNGDKSELYMDVYRKKENIPFKISC